VPFQIYASASDYDGGPVARVDFFWHGPDWKQNWVKLGSDTDAGDGWSYRVNPTQYGSVSGAALYIQAVSRTGGVKGSVMWDLSPDRVTPTSALDPLPGEIGSTVFLLNWSASDLQNDIHHFELQYQVDTGGGMSAWQNWSDPYHKMPIPGEARAAWFTGLAGASYNFRLRAVDKAGNTEFWLDRPEASTRLSGTCAPDPNEISGQTTSNAFVLSRSSFSPVFNFCAAGQTGAGDIDYAAIEAQAGETLLVLVIPDGGGTAFSVRITGSGINQATSWQSPDYENSVSIKFTAPASGRYYLEIRPLRSAMFGTDMKYEVWYGPGSWKYLPFLGR
jgi:hypothetical protein